MKVDENTMQSSASLQKLPPQPRSGAVFWLFAVLSISIVLGTVLLSNDMRNLRSLALRLGLNVETTTTNIPASIKPATTGRLSYVVLPPILRTPVNLDYASDFQWVRQVSGRALCERLRAQGVAVSEWAETAFNSQTFECIFEDIQRDDAGALLSSFFLVVRGDADGIGTGIRVKLTSPPLGNDGYLQPWIMKILEQVLNEPYWPDFAEALKAVRELRDFNSKRGGMAFSFSQEPTWPGRYNLTLTPSNSAGTPMRLMARRVLPAPLGTDLPARSAMDEAIRMPFLNGWISRADDVRPLTRRLEEGTEVTPLTRRQPWTPDHASQRLLAGSVRPPLWQFTR
jgi:hypothetical protein